MDRGIGIVLCGAALAALLPGQTAWRSVPSAASPSERSGAVMLQDGTYQDTVLFGGLTTAGPSSETWLFDAGSGWTLAPGPSPSARYGHAADGEVLFGGFDGTSYRNDLWMRWDRRWIPIATAGAQPAGRAFAAMTQSVGMTMIHGGITSQGVTGELWTRRSQNGAQRWVRSTGGPPARYGHAMERPTRVTDVTLMFGGVDANGAVLGDTWLLDPFGSGTWQRVSPARRPPARAGHTLTYDVLRNTIVMFGGIDAQRRPLNDVWEWVDGDWRSMTTAVSPPARSMHVARFDAASESTIVFGGLGRGDTWRYDTLFPPSARRFGHGCGGAGIASLGAGRLGWIGGTAHFSASLGTSLAGPGVFVFGLSSTRWLGAPLPVDLGPIGMPGCSLWVSVDAAFTVPVYPSLFANLWTSYVELPIPAAPALAGATIYAQYFGDRSVATNALEMVIGWR